MKAKTIGKRIGALVCVEMISDFVFEGGDPRALTGYDHERIEELADILDAFNYRASAKIIRERLSRSQRGLSF